MIRSLLFALVIFGVPSAARAQLARSWNLLPTGNGHGFSIFDRTQDKITYFLEHPYRYVAPGADDRTTGIGRRNLAHDLYFGFRANNSSTWLFKCGTSGCVDYDNIEYEEQTNIIHGTASFQGASIDAYYFAPYGYPGNGLVTLLKITNNGGSALDISTFLKINFSLGGPGMQGRTDPTANGETVTWVPGGVDHAEETGTGGGHAIYVPIGGQSHVSCGTDDQMYTAVIGGGAIGDNHMCSGDNQVPLFQQDLHVGAGQSGWWGVAVLFVDDNPNDARASLFSDPASISDILTRWKTFLNMRSPQAIHDDALQEWNAYRKNTAPTQLNDMEKKIWRQQEAVLRQGQILEYAKKNYGMVLASLPPGEWHTGWVRDGTYAVAALAMTGHYTEAQRAMDFYLGSQGGFFSSSNYLNRNYRISVCRFFGDAEEEGDFNPDGPNIETDGWGLVLWAARMYLHYSCDLAWLDKTTWQGDTNYNALKQIASDIEFLVKSDLPGPDNSIWEVHWNKRQVFSYTAAAHIRGLFDFADIARAHNDMDSANHYSMLAQAMLDKAKTALVNPQFKAFASYQGVAGQNAFVDGSTVGFFDWHLIKPDDPLYMGTLQTYSRLVTGFGGYRRIEPNLSLTGQAAGTYDLAEWILLDIRIADAYRRAGYALNNPDYVQKAEQVIDKITQSAAVNDNLIPELYDPMSGVYNGVVPMNGYGAGAWTMTQLEKYGQPAPGYDVGFAHCTDPCFSKPCTDPHKGQCMASGMSYTCACDPGYHDKMGACTVDTKCSPTTCGANGTCDDKMGIVCTCNMGYSGAHCEGCAPGFNMQGTTCTAIAGSMPGGNMGGGMMGSSYVFNDGPASLCEILGPGRPWDALGIMSILLASILVRRYRKRRGG